MLNLRIFEKRKRVEVEHTNGTIENSSEIAISINFTAEHAENAKDRIGLKTVK
jgi:hypothetical protein